MQLASFAVDGVSWCHRHFTARGDEGVELRLIPAAHNVAAPMAIRPSDRPERTNERRPIPRRSFDWLPSLTYCMRLVVGFSQAAQIASIVVC
jgi:hypothetical protein